jgi:hypothetical protein
MVVSCSDYSPEVESALKLAGNNRKELEKVLDRYKFPGNRLKRRAAEFLITNMPYHYTINSDLLDTFRHYLVSQDSLIWGTLKTFEEEYGSLNRAKYKETPDIETVTAEYLIRNIEVSFRIWNDAPWGKHMSFEDFCEEILPYRVGTEPLEDWKEVYRHEFQPVLDSLPHDGDPVKACRMLCEHVTVKPVKWIYQSQLSVPGLGADAMLRARYGSCRDQAEFMMYVMRSVGLSVGMDIIVQNPNNAFRGHYWNYVRDTTGQCLSFDFYEQKPGDARYNGRKLGRVYRECFTPQPESLPFQSNRDNIPAVLNRPLIRDVSRLYFPDRELAYYTGEKAYDGEIMYLSVFNNSRWIPITWSKASGDTARFRYMEPGIAYMPYACYGQNAAAFGDPILYYNDGTIVHVKPDTENRQSMILTRKYGILAWWEQFRVRTIGGRFQGAGKPDFSDVVTLHTVPDSVAMQYYNIALSPREFRYLRYFSADSGYNNMAEIRFFSGGAELQGKIIGTEGSFEDHPERTKDAVFDGDPLTFYEAAEASGSWAGLELDAPHTVTRLRYLIRNDDNAVRPGDRYELVYWDNGQWISLGEQTADRAELKYENAPSGALFLLHNHTRGKEERPFTYENGRQVWW